MRHLKPLIILALILAAPAVPALFFYVRPPALVVTDEPFAALYGASRLKRQQAAVSLRLFRRVKPVMVADGASPDIAVAAITGAVKSPLCVLFPRSQALAARRFHEQFPEVPAAVLSGAVRVAEIPSPDGFLCVYGTDREADLYRAGLCAGLLGDLTLNPVKPVEKDVESAGTRRMRISPPDESAENPPDSVQKTYVLWQDRFVQAAGRELFSGGVQENDPEAEIVFVSSAAGLPDMQGVACAVLTAAGAEYLDKNPAMPLILFSWLDPALISKEVVVLFDDSPWALAVPAVRLALRHQAEGKIPSKPLIFSGKIGNNNVFRALVKSAKKMPLKDN